MTMNRFTIAACAALIMIWNPSTGDAQSLFGGQGIGASSSDSSQPNLFPSYQRSRPSAAQPASRNPFSGLFTRKSEAKPEPGFQFPKLPMPKWEWPSLPKPGSQASWLPTWEKPAWMERDPNQPSFFEKMNQRSRAWADQTSDWFRSATGTQPKTATWDSIREEMEMIQKQNEARRAATPQVQPNVRSARAGDERVIRY